MGESINSYIFLRGGWISNKLTVNTKPLETVSQLYILVFYYKQYRLGSHDQFSGELKVAPQY
jgi:hypothetical protein